MYAQTNVFNRVKKKHGQETLKIVRTLEDSKTPLMKIESDIVFIKTCKREQLIPTFAKVKLSIKNANKKLQVKLAKLLMETELQDKHHAKRKMKTTIRKLMFELRRSSM